MTLLGCIKQISELGLTVSLPHQLTGSISITEITSLLSKQISVAVEGEDSDEEDLNIPDLNDYFSIGQMVPCIVVDVQEEPRRRLDLSLKPELVNSSITVSNIFPGMLLGGMIVSKQDHGYEVHLGVDQLTAFVNFKNIPQGVEFQVGQYQCFHVIKAGKVAQLSTNDLVTSKIASKQSIPFDSLKPGMAVDVMVEKHLKNGLSVRFNDVFEGTIDWFHLNAAVHNEEALQKQFKVNQPLTARIIMVDSDTKKIALSLLPNVMVLNQPAFAVEYGDIVSVLVERMDSSQGLLVNGGDCGMGYIHISKISDEKTDVDHLPIGSVHSARVIGFDHLQNLILFSTSQKVLDSPFLRATDVKPGMLLRGTLTVLNEKGAAVQLTDSVSGWIPKNQMMETTLKSIPAKFKQGADIKCRVLYVDAEKKRVYLTAKKTLVSSKLEPISSYDSAAVGNIAHGVIVGKGPYGVIVQFYNKVKALATMKDLGYGVSLSTLNIGQTVKCRVLSVNPENEQMRVSLNLVGGDIATDALDAMTVGQVIICLYLSSRSCLVQF
jgi:rRNA biogenesis protein RRP5